MTAFTLILGNKAYSSWSLRGWLLMKRSGAPFEERVIPLDRPGFKAEIRVHSPSGRVPALEAGDLTIWDSLAIAEYLHERYPEARLWPADPEVRAIARAVTAEMHAGFAVLRERLPMDLKRAPIAPGKGHMDDPALGAEIARIVEIWTDCRSRAPSRTLGRAPGRTSGGGRFLFGEFCAADAFYAPVATRFHSYGVALEGAAAAYRDALLAWPDLAAWTEAAQAEPWSIETG
jgi:glutathione S-transferase